jgi:hypothetical protein
MGNDKVGNSLVGQIWGAATFLPFTITKMPSATILHYHSLTHSTMGVHLEDLHSQHTVPSFFF